MKISDLQKALKNYDSKSGLFRWIKDEPHIKQLRVFIVTLGDTERDLTSEELLKLVSIGLGKKSNNGSASCQTFDMIFRALGGKTIYAKLKEADLLDKDTVFIITQLACQSVQDINQLIEAFDVAKDFIYKVSQSIKPDSKMGAIISLLAVNHQLTLDIWKQLSIVEDGELTLLYDSLTILSSDESIRLSTKNIKSCIQFSSSHQAIQNLLYFLRFTAKDKRLDQKFLNELFAQFKAMSLFSIAKTSIDYLNNIGYDLTRNVRYLLSNNKIDIDKIVGELKKLNLDNHDQNLSLFTALLNNYAYHETILSGVNQLSPDNMSYIDSVYSCPTFAKKIADTLELLTHKELSSRFKTIYANLIQGEAKYAVDILKLLKIFQSSGFLDEKNMSWAFDNFKESEYIRLCILSLQNNAIYKQKNIDRLTSSRGSIHLLQKALQLLSKTQLLNQNNFDALLDFVEKKSSKDLDSAVNQLTNLASDKQLIQSVYNKWLFSPTGQVDFDEYANDSDEPYESNSKGVTKYSLFPIDQKEEEAHMLTSWLGYI